MRSCNDPVLTYLNSLGYLVVLLPKADVRPLQLYEVQGKKLHRLGELTSLLTAGSEIIVPAVDTNLPASNISGQVTSTLSIGVGLSVLGSFLGAMGGSTLGLRAQYSTAKTVTFEFHDVLEDRVDVILLDQYLADADVNPYSTYVGTLLEASVLAVTTNTIKSHKITMEAKDASGMALALSIPAIQGVVGGNVQVSCATAMSSRLTYEGPMPLIFGFQARQLFYDQGQYTAIKPLPPPATIKGLPPIRDDGTELLMVEGPFVQLHTQ